ncbi:MAG: ATP-binding protein [Paludibacteraceae bacterium]|nr:ATP-binding protein [Paludibacteraceae bacterium]
MIIGRQNQQQLLLSLLEMEDSQFVAVYGRRRIGKTYLVRETYSTHIAFQHTGLQNVDKKGQLKEFGRSLLNAGMAEVPRISDWFDAFFALGQFLQSRPEGKKVVFIDELPWMDTPKSNLVAALDHFWNGWASARKDIVLVICGSATSWIISKIVKNYGGLHNRLTRQIYLEPFTLHECEQFAAANNLGMSRRNILETYMVLGGIPYYWQFMQKEYSPAQNIDRLFFEKTGPLRGEFTALYASLFRNPQSYIDVITALGTKKAGMTRSEIIDATGLNIGGKLTTMLEELEECDFIRSFYALGKQKKDIIYQLTDNFTLFYFKFLAEKRVSGANYWSQMIVKPQYNTWSGLAFERVCFQHIEQIRRALGISGIISNIYSWQYRPKESNESGVQIDMLIDRDDQVINLCEIKFAQGEYELTESYDKALRNKLATFVAHSGTRKGVSLLIITSFGLKRNQWANNIPIQLTMDDLFAF